MADEKLSPKIKASRNLAQDLANHDITKIKDVISRRMDQLDNFDERTLYILAICRDMISLGHSINVKLLEQVTKEPSKKIHDKLMREYNIMLEHQWREHQASEPKPGKQKFAFILKHPLMTHAALGYLPDFFDLDDPRPAKEQLHERYAHGGGYHPMKGKSFIMGDSWIKFPGDELFPLLAEAKLHKETLRFYYGSWLAIVQEDGSFEVCRVD